MDLSQSLEFAPTGERSPAKTPFEGVHFSDSDVPDGVLHGARRGSSPQSSDAHRLHIGRSAPGGVHAYRTGAPAHPSIGARKHAHKITGNFSVADIDGGERGIWATALTQSYKQNLANGMDPEMAKAAAQNDAEHALLDAGYDGYAASKHQPNSVFLFGDQKVARAEV